MSRKPALRWRIFAAAITAMVLPFEFGALFQGPSAYDAARYVIDTVAVIGLMSYAFVRPSRLLLFWRVFGPVFVLFSAALIAKGIPLMVALLRDRPMGFATGVSVLAAVLPIPAFMALGLLRYGGWFRSRSAEPDYAAIFS